MTRDGGRSWTEITPPDLPRWATVRMIEASSREAGTAYVAAEAHKRTTSTPTCGGLETSASAGSGWTKA